MIRHAACNGNLFRAIALGVIKCWCSPVLSGILICAALAWGSEARADVLTTTDGRVFEGTVASEKNGVVQFDTVVSDVRARLSFPKAKVKSIDKKPISQSTLDASATDPALSESSADTVTLYLEVPIQGRIKEQVFAQAIRSTLSYAKVHGVKHIVFTVDSSGGAVDEAASIARTLRQFEEGLTYHAVITNCTGEALVIPFLCQTVHLQPGATVGGSEQKMENLPGKYAATDEAVVRTQIGENLAEVARQRGRKGDIIRAMIDPTAVLAAWIDEDKQIQTGPSVPAGIPADRVIFADGPDTVLVLSFEQATRLGIPTIKGGADAVGPLLRLPNWKEESSYGRDVAKRTMTIRKQMADSAQAKFEDAAARNISMRETTKQAIQANLKQAAQWDPTKASYENLKTYADLGFGPFGGWDTQLWTPESRQKWRNRTEACAYFLRKAQSGITTMMRLDKEAGSLGLSPTFKGEELALMLDDVNVKLTMLSRGANRIGE